MKSQLFSLILIALFVTFAQIHRMHTPKKQPSRILVNAHPKDTSTQTLSASLTSTPVASQTDGPCHSIRFVEDEKEEIPTFDVYFQQNSQSVYDLEAKLFTHAQDTLKDDALFNSVTHPTTFWNGGTKDLCTNSNGYYTNDRGKFLWTVAPNKDDIQLLNWVTQYATGYIPLLPGQHYSGPKKGDVGYIHVFKLNDDASKCEMHITNFIKQEIPQNQVFDSLDVMVGRIEYVNNWRFYSFMRRKNGEMFPVKEVPDAWIIPLAAQQKKHGCKLIPILRYKMRYTGKDRCDDYRPPTMLENVGFGLYIVSFYALLGWFIYSRWIK
eukprot:178738_1